MLLGRLAPWFRYSDDSGDDGDDGWGFGDDEGEEAVAESVPQATSERRHPPHPRLGESPGTGSAVDEDGELVDMKSFPCWPSGVQRVSRSPE